MENWINESSAVEADKDAEYVAVNGEIDLNEIKEPILCAPNDPDDARLLSEVQGDKIDDISSVLAWRILVISIATE